MWSNYLKVYSFRDCFDEDTVQSNIAAIQNLLNLEQHSKSYGAFITLDILSTQIATSIEAYQNEDGETWNIVFFNKGNEICNISLWNYKEIQLCFEIEEEIETGEFLIHYCTVKGFKEYQM